MKRYDIFQDTPWACVKYNLHKWFEKKNHLCTTLLHMCGNSLLQYNFSNIDEKKYKNKILKWHTSYNINE